MKASDLDLPTLLTYEAEGGIIRFGGERALLLDAVALGLLRRELIESLGTTAARGLLTRFGYAHGWRTAESLRNGFPWDSETEWRRAGARLHTLQGIVIAEPKFRETDAAAGEPLVEGIWRESYEAEQHLLNLGQAEEPVCWTLAGFASGHLSCVYGREVVAFEDRCRGKGDAVCHAVARFREDWGEERAAELQFYNKACVGDEVDRIAAELKRLEKRLAARKRELAKKGVPFVEVAGLVAQSPAIQRVIELARRVAQVDSTVLVTGESGVGKERVARLIHDESARSGKPFVAINCGAVPESLLESELFGHARGAFTGASSDRPGLFEAANGGTLLLDEIGDVPPAMQVKLLRALQEREVRRVGENRNRPVDVRVLAATNRDLVTEVNAARFRQDLYYRLRVVEIRVPPLRERRDDLLPLARAFLSDATARTRRKISGFTPAAANQIVRYSWPGNVRELENAVERAVVLSRGTRIDVEDLPEEVSLALPSHFEGTEARPLAAVERDYILAVLAAAGGNRASAAEQLGIGTATLYRKLKQYEADGPPAS